MRRFSSLLLAVVLVTTLFAGTSVQGAIVIYNVLMNGASEEPPNASPATGTATITFDDLLFTMRVQTSFSGLQGNVTAAHIHAATPNPFSGTAGVATQVPTFVGFPSGVKSGSYDQTFDMTLATSYRAAYITANGGTPITAFTALMDASAQGRAYLNIHSEAFPGGEIRGFLTAVPEPSSMVVVGALLMGAVAHRRRQA